MKNIFNNTINSELFLVYTLIFLVILLIIAIIILDKKESKKKPQNLFDTLNMKIIANPDDVKSEKNASVEKQEEIEEVVIKKNDEQVEKLEDIILVDNIKSETPNNNLKETINEIKNEVYQEPELDKTQAQIRVEEITKALEKAQQEQEQEEDKYQKFEEEQEKNAIISYNELKKSFDRLYSENEKIQYLDDDEIPINIEELYELRDNKSKIKIEEAKPIIKPKEVTVSGFKSSPLISPVYGIQTPPVENNTKVKDNDIESANLFLKNLKELKNNLE